MPELNPDVAAGAERHAEVRDTSRGEAGATLHLVGERVTHQRRQRTEPFGVPHLGRHQHPAVAGELDEEVVELERFEVRFDLGDEGPVEPVEFDLGHAQSRHRRLDHVDAQAVDEANLTSSDARL